MGRLLVPLVVVGAVLGYGAISTLFHTSTPAVPAAIPQPLKPRESITFSAVASNVRKTTRGNSTRAERYQIVLSDAPEGQGDISVYPGPFAVTDDDMTALIGQRVTFTCEKYVHRKDCFFIKVIEGGGRRFTNALKEISWLTKQPGTVGQLVLWDTKQVLQHADKAGQLAGGRSWKVVYKQMCAFDDGLVALTK